MSPEKTVLPTRLLSCLIAISMFLLISSSLSLVEFHHNFFIPQSVLQFILAKNASIHPIPNAIADTHENPVFPNEKEDIPNQNVASQGPNTIKSPIFPIETLDKQDTSNQKVSSEYPNTENATNEQEKLLCDKNRALLRVYMYDLPPKFHFGLLGWKGSANQTWPNVSHRNKIPSYPGGLNLQHSNEYWLTLDLLSSTTENVVRPCSAIRVHNSSEADIVFVPFFSSLSYNRNSKRQGKQKGNYDRLLQEELVEFLHSRNEWKSLDGRDHLIVAHHPNSLLFARKILSSCMFVLSDFGRYPSKIANLEKDVIAPYKHMVRTIADEKSASFDERRILVYFQGAIYRKDGGAIRQVLYQLLKDEKDVHFTFGSVRSNGINEAGRGMVSSKFCLNIAGDTPSSNRLFDAIASHCVPVIISDEIELPYEDVLDYSEFCVFVHAADALKKGYLLNLLRGVSREKWTKMWETLKKISGHFEYQYPSQRGDAVDMIWQTVSRKKVETELNVHRKKRYRRWQL
ncbi:hypothetical protein BUALT_Bualt07G0062300 [Buddleja alternifolia]|uniref:Exostosin GT47 domain-containing protein n=1 Tax=Buddleja alternifolia TaxID=168488 RepID=A0AAV6X9K1_9LAMI|nr:hypothetical protein BUALT_Bualt07G0062300 [Buddleja alternifolia]